MPDAALIATALLLFGLLLLALELFIPSFGLIGLCSVVCLGISFWSACKAWWGTDPTFFWTYVLMLVGGIPGSLFLSITAIERTQLGKHLRLEPPQKQTPDAAPEFLALKGRRGKAAGVMTPGGIVVIDGNRHHAESEGMMIENDTEVIVIGLRGARLLIRPASMLQPVENSKRTQRSVPDQAPNPELLASVLTQDPDAAEAPTPPRRESPPQSDQLDFDIPGE